MERLQRYECRCFGLNIGWKGLNLWLAFDDINDRDFAINWSSEKNVVEKRPDYKNLI